MSKRKRRKYQGPKAPPADPLNYVLVHTKEGSYWRRKRGTVTKAELNPALRKSARAMALASPIAKRIKEKLQEFLKELDTGRFIANISAKMKKTYLDTGNWNFSLLAGYDLQPDHLLGTLLQNNYSAIERNGELTIQIPITRGTVKAKNSLVSDYYFELILLHGDPSKKNSVRVESETSSLYRLGRGAETECILSLILPKKTPWMALLKLSCHEGNEPASHPRHYGMKVVKAGG